jgi:heterodisulfide reductase subunit C
MADAKPPAAPPAKGTFIAERAYVDDRRITEPEHLESGGVDMSGRWGLLIGERTLTAFDHSLRDEVQALAAGRHMHRCFQCGNCTGVCPVAEEHPEFNPRYYIHVVRMGWPLALEDIRRHVYLCESCGRCSEVCPRDVNPSAVMVAIGTVVRRRKT